MVYWQGNLTTGSKQLRKEYIYYFKIKSSQGNLTKGSKPDLLFVLCWTFRENNLGLKKRGGGADFQMSLLTFNRLQ